MPKAGLGPDWALIEEGLPRGTLNRDDPVQCADRNALRTLRGLLEGHRPLDRMIVMLGTTDCKARFAGAAAYRQGAVQHGNAAAEHDLAPTRRGRTIERCTRTPACLSGTAPG